MLKARALNGFPSSLLLQQSLPESDEHLAHFDRGGCECSMLALGTKLTVHRPLKVGFELIRFLDRHRHIAREVSVGRTAASFCDVRRYRLRGASNLIRKTAPFRAKGRANAADSRESEWAFCHT